MFITDRKTEQCWHYPDYAALKKDWTILEVFTIDSEYVDYFFFSEQFVNIFSHH